MPNDPQPICMCLRMPNRVQWLTRRGERGICSPHQAKRALAPPEIFWECPPIGSDTCPKISKNSPKKNQILKGKCKFWLENSKNRLENVKNRGKNLNFRPIFRLENFDYF